MNKLYFIIPIMFFIFTIADAVADSLINRKSGVDWWTFHIFTWIRRYSTNSLLILIWFYIIGISCYTIYLAITLLIILWIVWILIYKFITKQIKIKKLK